jgi:phospholipase C
MACLSSSFQCSSRQGAGRGSTSLTLCGNGGVPPPIKHVVLVMMENRTYGQVVGSGDAPYETYLAGECGNAAAAFAATHWSAADYLAISAGEYPLQSPHGCAFVRTCADGSDNLYNQLSSAGLTWRGYMESMSSPCDRTSEGGYKIGHDPVIFYTDIPAATCRDDDVGVADLSARSGAFWDNLRDGTLPSFSWVTPNATDDGEGPGNSAEKERAADSWLQGFLGTVQDSNSYQAGDVLVLVTYDEGDGQDSEVGEDCADESMDMPVVDNVSAHQESCHVPLFVVYPYTPTDDVDGTFFDHYSITKTVEDIFGLPYLDHAGDVQTDSLLGHFGIVAGASAATVDLRTVGR